MGVSDYTEKLKQAIDKDETVVICADCSVSYSGRAESFLPFGERIILIKSDKNLLVHQPKGTTPVNYMKQGTLHKIEPEGKNIVLKSSNSAMKEFMDITLRKIHFINSRKLEDNSGIELNGTEKHMADMIMQNPKIIGRDFIPLSREEHTKYGFIDVFGHDRKKNLVVIECKRFCADLGAVTQLRRYVEKIKELKGIENVRGMIASPKISANALRMLNDWGFEHRKVDPPKYLERHSKKQKGLDEFQL